MFKYHKSTVMWESSWISTASNRGFPHCQCKFGSQNFGYQIWFCTRYCLWYGCDVHFPLSSYTMHNRVDSRFAPSQWETALLCNASFIGWVQGCKLIGNIHIILCTQILIKNYLKYFLSFFIWPTITWMLKPSVLVLAGWIILRCCIRCCNFKDITYITHSSFKRHMCGVFYENFATV